MVYLQVKLCDPWLSALRYTVYKRRYINTFPFLSLVTEAHACEKLAQGWYLEEDRPRFEPATFWIISCSIILSLHNYDHALSKLVISFSCKNFSPAFQRYLLSQRLLVGFFVLVYTSVVARQLLNALRSTAKCRVSALKHCAVLQLTRLRLAIQNTKDDKSLKCCTSEFHISGL